MKMMIVSVADHVKSILCVGAQGSGISYDLHSALGRGTGQRKERIVSVQTRHEMGFPWVQTGQSSSTRRRFMRRGIDCIERFVSHFMRMMPNLGTPYLSI